MVDSAAAHPNRAVCHTPLALEADSPLPSMPSKLPNCLPPYPNPDASEKPAKPLRQTETYIADGVEVRAYGYGRFLNY